MTTKAIKRKRDDGPLKQDWQPVGERAPSIIRKDQPVVARAIAFISMMLVVLGGLAIVLHNYQSRVLLATMIGLGWGVFFVMLGAAGLIFHAFNEKEAGYRRLYLLLGGALIVLGVGLRLWPMSHMVPGEEAARETVIGGYFLAYGSPSLALGLCFLIAFVRHETDEKVRENLSRVIGLIAVLLIVVGFAGGLMYEQFLMEQGVMHLLLGLVFAAAYVGMEKSTSTKGYWAGYALGAVGLAMIVIALGKGLPFERFVPGLGVINRGFGWVRWLSDQPGAPFLFTYLGLEYLLLSIGICSDNQLVVLTRRELGAFFYSPIAYIVLIVLAVLGGWSFMIFAGWLAEASSMMGMSSRPPDILREPIVRSYIVSLVPVICVILLVPLVTMRVISEENRSGTLEVMLTAPVRESTVVLSKFFASLRIFMLAWYSWGLYLVALAGLGGVAFDYRPVLSFAIVLLATGAGFVAMGVFFSSVTKNQIVAAMLSLMGMIMLLALFLLKEFSQAMSPVISNILTYISFVDLWWLSSNGLVAPRYLLFHVSFAVFFIFLTIKVLESRKWR